MKNSVILFDIDYTLFDVGKYRELVFAKLHTFFPEIPNFNEIAAQSYDEIRQTGWFTIPTFTKQLVAHISTKVLLKTLEDVWRDEKLLEEAIYPEAWGVLTLLTEWGYDLGIFSSGHWNFQKSKITKLAHFFKDEHIHIHALKDAELPRIIQKYEGKKVLLIDDYIPVIENAKKVDKHITAIWIKRGRLAEKVSPSLAYPPDYSIETLEELPTIVQSI